MRSTRQEEVGGKPPPRCLWATRRSGKPDRTAMRQADSEDALATASYKHAAPRASGTDRPLTQAVLTSGGRGRPRSGAGGSDMMRTGASAFRCRGTDRPLTHAVRTEGLDPRRHVARSFLTTEPAVTEDEFRLRLSSRGRQLSLYRCRQVN